MFASPLYNLIQQIEYKTNLHIGVLFFKDYGNKMCELPHGHQIHESPICEFFKSYSRQSFFKCVRCRNFAIKKALKYKTAFGGLCINGIYEYTHPVLIDGEVAAIVFIGNILNGEESVLKIKKSAKGTPLPLLTLEDNFSEEKCKNVCITIDNYIRFLLEKYENDEGEKPLIKNIKNFIEENLNFETNIKTIAETFYYNPRYLCRLFKKECGVSLTDYITSRRLKRAKQLLTDTNHSVLEISAESGFNNVTYFNKLFKANFHVTPTEYRKNK